jgi:hypothetical protein
MYADIVPQRRTVLLARAFAQIDAPFNLQNCLAHLCRPYSDTLLFLQNE